MAHETLLLACTSSYSCKVITALHPYLSHDKVYAGSAACALLHVYCCCCICLYVCYHLFPA